MANSITINKYARDINCLKEDNREIRENALCQILNNITIDIECIINNNNNNTTDSKEYLIYLTDTIYPNILNLVEDKIARIRERILKFINLFIINYYCILNDHLLVIILSSLYSRLYMENNNDFKEKMENIRILTIDIIKNIVLFNNNNNNKNNEIINNIYNYNSNIILVKRFVLTDIIKIITISCKDNNPEMKEKSACFIIELLDYIDNTNNISTDNTLKDIISDNCKETINILSLNCCHQRYKIRKISSIALIYLLQFNSSFFLHNESLLYKLSCDKHTEVRKETFLSLTKLFKNINITVIKKIGANILCLIMLGMSDEDLDIKSTTFDNINILGKYYKDLLEKIDSIEKENNNLNIINNRLDN